MVNLNNPGAPGNQKRETQIMSTTSIFSTTSTTSTTSTPQRSIYVEAREWFDKKNSNSYYSALVRIDGVSVFTTGLTYGHGSQFEYDVTDDLVRLGYLPESMSGRNIHWADYLGELDVYTVKYDTLRRDLWKSNYPEPLTP